MRLNRGAIPPNIALIFPGYADSLLYDLGFIPNDAPLDTVRQRYAITDAVVATVDQPDFSRLLRLQLNVQESDGTRRRVSGSEGDIVAVGSPIASAATGANPQNCST